MRAVTILDGAMGSALQARDLTIDDYEGHENCCDVLVRSRPEVVSEIHDSFLAAGCDALETNTFGANRIVLGEFGISEDAHALNVAGARLAREVADAHSTADHPRQVFGSMGPGTKLPTLGHTTWQALFDSYREQADGLIEGGVDRLLVETCQDLLQAKAAVAACMDARKRADREIPVHVSVTVETIGTLLIGSEVGAAIAALSPFDLASLGLNCATGPTEMSPHVAYLAHHSPFPLSVLPNAGLPELVDGETVYPLNETAFAEWLLRFVQEDGAVLVGGCCGTTPGHLAAAVQALDGAVPAEREPESRDLVSSIYRSVPLDQDTSVLIVGERTNANGSRLFRRLLEEDDLEGMVAMAREQEQEGAHILDVCAAYVGRDENADLGAILERFATAVTIPLMIDSTEADVIEEALQRLGGRCIVNSVNLEEGEERMDAVLPSVKRHGAAVIALTIDEDGMARTAKSKVEIAGRIFDLATGKWGLQAGDILFDPLTFTVCTGNEDDRPLALATLDALEGIAERCPGSRTLLGVSNVSFGLDPPARKVLNSVFLAMASKRGLGAAIVHAAGILPLHQIPDDRRRAAEDLLLAKSKGALMDYMALFDGEEEDTGPAGPALEDIPLDERLQKRIVDGIRTGLEEDLDQALEDTPALDIINNTLLAGMKTVGDLFGAGEMQLPFVLQAAETMKAAVAYLEPHMDRQQGESKGTLVLATVRGDVHDIGKNLVDILVTNNGFRVVNLGIRQPVSAILDAANKEDADVIGLSGLLVRSTKIMREDLEELARTGVDLPVILGGAALTRGYVEKDCQGAYTTGTVTYAKDAFDGLNVMEDVAAGRMTRGPAAVADTGDSVPDTAPVQTDRPRPGMDDDSPPRPVVQEPCPEPTTTGVRVVEDLDLAALLPWINERTLFRFQWGFRRGVKSEEEQAAFLEAEVRPRYLDLVERCREGGWLEPKAAYGLLPCRTEGDELAVLDPETGDEAARFTFPRQESRGRLCVPDFFAGDPAWIGLQAVTVGARATEEAARLLADDHYTDYLFLHGLSVEATEALAEMIHARLRADWGIGGDDARDPKDLLRGKYRGTRWSFGYPACPDLAQQEGVLRLLGAMRIGISLTEEDQLVPEQSTTALVSAHSQARWFKA